MRILNQSKAYQEKPSDIIGLGDEYLAFCFNEACLYMQNKLDERNDEGKLIVKSVESLNWLDKKNKSNQDNKKLIEFLDQH